MPERAMITVVLCCCFESSGAYYGLPSGQHVSEEIMSSKSLLRLMKIMWDDTFQVQGQQRSG